MYGELLEKEGDTENHYPYTGEYYDGTSNLYYLRARYMNPATGNFLTMDTYEGSIYGPDTLHKYMYANSNPVTYSDPTGGSGTVFEAGKKTFDNFNIDDAYVKPKHLSITGGNGQKFIGASKIEAESILREALSNGEIISITDNGLTKVGNQSYEIIIDEGKTIGTKGEHLIQIILSEDGGDVECISSKRLNGGEYGYY